ncbi:hypothetical protein BGW41_005076 [Actinomortierella wolfii]|nr:hypothetical protein BGW41_005076 [Actinomortierella wolfii]
MSTFDGVIREFPTLAIDNFVKRPGVNRPLENETPHYLDLGNGRKFIDRRPRMAHYYIDAWTFGYEEIWVGLSRAFNSKIHVSRYLYELYGAIDEFLAEKIQPHLTLDGRTARFHSCRLGPDCGYGAGIQSGNTVGREVIRIQPNVSWFSAVMQQGRGLGGQAPLLDSVFEGKVAGRSTRFSIQERIPPSLMPERLRQWQIQQRHRRDEVKGNPLLSPRSRHLQKKMEKLKRQLTRAKSEETDLQRKDRVSQSSGSGSSLSAGPLTLDMDVLERKRLWWLQEDREQSTTQEDTEEEEDEEENGDVGKHIVHENHALADTCIFPDTQQKPPEHAHQRQQDEWLELSTVELSRTKLEEAEVPTENHPSKVPPSSIASLNSPFHENSQAVASTVLSSSAEGSQAPSLSSGSCYQDTAMTPSALDSSPPRSSASAPQTYGLELDKQQQQLHNFESS